MTIDSDNLLESILASIGRIKYIRPDDIPNIDLYMDQVTTFMDKRLKATTRNPGDDKVLTKTMINNYAKNDLLPPPEKKKYTKEHILMLIFIYYFKNILTINDIQTLFGPISEDYFRAEEGMKLEDIYKIIVEQETPEIDLIKEDIAQKFEKAQLTFEDAPEEDREYLKQFAFICSLIFDVYVKKLLVEKMIDDMREKSETGKPEKEGRAKPEKTDAKGQKAAKAEAVKEQKAAKARAAKAARAAKTSKTEPAAES